MKKVLKSDYLIIPEKQLMIELVEGIITPGSLINMKKIQLADKDFNPSYNVIGDISKTTFDLSTNQIEAFVTFIVENKEGFGENKTAMVLSTINQKIYIDILKSHQNKFPQNLKICTNLEEAIAWVNHVSDKDFIEGTIKKMRKDLRILWVFESDF